MDCSSTARWEAIYRGQIKHLRPSTLLKKQGGYWLKLSDTKCISCFSTCSAKKSAFPELSHVAISLTSIKMLMTTLTLVGGISGALVYFPSSCLGNHNVHAHAASFDRFRSVWIYEPKWTESRPQERSNFDCHSELWEFCKRSQQNPRQLYEFGLPTCLSCVSVLARHHSAACLYNMAAIYLCNNVLSSKVHRSKMVAEPKLVRTFQDFTHKLSE